MSDRGYDQDVFIDDGPTDPSPVSGPILPVRDGGLVFSFPTIFDGRGLPVADLVQRGGMSQSRVIERGVMLAESERMLDLLRRVERSLLRMADRGVMKGSLLREVRQQIQACEGQQGGTRGW